MFFQKSPVCLAFTRTYHVYNYVVTQLIHTLNCEFSDADVKICDSAVKMFPLCIILLLLPLAAAAGGLLDGLLNYSSTLKMEAIRSSETSGATQRTTRHHIPEDDTLYKT
jgi:hypothetical protein